MRLLVLFLALTGVQIPARAETAPVSPKLRVLVETDIGGDPDDEGSLVRFLLYTNEWDVEGIVCDRPRTRNQGARTGLELAQKIIAAYGECYPNLVKHAQGYPAAAGLLGITVPGYNDSTEGVALIKEVLARDDPRPIWYANWGSDSGTKSNILRALDELKAGLTAERFTGILRKLHVTRNAEKLGPHDRGIALFVDTRNPDKWYHAFSRLTQNAGGCDVRRDMQSVGPLGACYPIPKEGDSLAFIHLIPTGLSDPTRPEWGGWSGRYAPLTASVPSSGGAPGPEPREGFFWASAEDEGPQKSKRDHTLARWAAALQNDFRARMIWSVTPDFGKANHEPRVVLNGDTGRDILRLQAKPGETLAFSAEGSRDPDGDALAYEWFVYPEAGTYRGEVPLTETDSNSLALAVPADADAVGASIHLVLAVTDDGTPPLTRYRRAVVEVSP